MPNFDAVALQKERFICISWKKKVTLQLERNEQKFKVINRQYDKQQ